MPNKPDLSPYLTQRKFQISARISEYAMPPVNEILVLGRDAPIGCIAMRRALELLVKTPFEHIEFDGDEVIADILVRESLLRRLPRERLIEFVLNRIKPMMGPDEVMHLDLEVTILLEESMS